jgi:MFS family permease
VIGVQIPFMVWGVERRIDGAVAAIALRGSIRRYRMRIRGFGRNLNLLLLSYLLCIFAYWGLYSLLGSLYLLRLGYDVKFVATINSIGFLAYGVFSYPAGHLASRWGKRRSLLAGALLSALYLAAFPLVESFPAETRSFLFVSVFVIGGAGYALYLACTAPSMMEVQPERRATAFSAYAIGNFAGQSLGYLAAGLLTALFGRLLGASEGSPAPYRLGLTVAAVVQLGSVACVASMRRSEPAPSGTAPAGEAALTPPTRLRRSLLAVVVSVGLLGTLLATSVQVFFSMHLDQTFHVPTGSIGAALSVVRGVPVAAFLLAAPLVKKLGAFGTALLSLIGACLAAVSVGLASQWLFAAGGYATMSFLGALGNPATSLLYQEAAPVEARAVVAGAQNAAYGLASTAILFAGGFLIPILGYGRFFLAGLVLNAVSVAVFAAYFSRPERRKAVAAAAVAPGPR